MFITVISDCISENDKARQATRFAGLFNITPTIIGVNSSLGKNATLEAAGALVDTLDAAGNGKGVVVVNVAPRGDKKDGTNGTHFSYFKYKNTLIIATIKDYCLSLVKKLNIVDKVNLLDTEEVLKYVEKEGLIDKSLKNYIANSQFRSFDFVPRVAKWLSNGVVLPFSDSPLTNHLTPPSAIWLIDSFGNAKTTILVNDLAGEHVEKYLNTNLGIFKFYNRLKDLPFGETAFYTGSSGIDDKRFIEIATQGIKGSAAKHLNLQIGSTIKIL